MFITRGMKQWTLDSQKKTTRLPRYYKKKVGRRGGASHGRFRGQIIQKYVGDMFHLVEYGSASLIFFSSLPFWNRNINITMYLEINRNLVASLCCLQ